MRRGVRNILFIMYDQLRFDYLGCTGHPHLENPEHGLAGRQWRAVLALLCAVAGLWCLADEHLYRALCAKPRCGLEQRAAEGRRDDAGRPSATRRAWSAGWSARPICAPTMAGMDRLGIARDGVIGARVSECGFDILVRDDGLWGEGPDGFYDERRSPYNAYLAAQGYDGSNPWQDYANAGVDEAGDIASGWFMKHAVRPANIRNEDSETPWLTSRMIEFLEARKARGRAVAGASVLYQTALALYRARALSRHVRQRAGAARPSRSVRAASIRTRFTRSSWPIRLAARFRATRCERR